MSKIMLLQSSKLTISLLIMLSTVTSSILAYSYYCRDYYWLYCQGMCGGGCNLACGSPWTKQCTSEELCGSPGCGPGVPPSQSCYGYLCKNMTLCPNWYPAGCGVYRRSPEIVKVVTGCS